MSYRCAGCEKVVGPNVPMLRHTSYREITVPHGEGTKTYKQVAKELPVCAECAPKLAAAVLTLKFGN